MCNVFQCLILRCCCFLLNACFICIVLLNCALNVYNTVLASLKTLSLDTNASQIPKTRKQKIQSTDIRDLAITENLSKPITTHK